MFPVRGSRRVIITKILIQYFVYLQQKFTISTCVIKCLNLLQVLKIAVIFLKSILKM